jgi:hypothetical protein
MYGDRPEEMTFGLEIDVGQRSIIVVLEDPF